MAYLVNRETLNLSSEFLETLEFALLNRATSMTPKHVLDLAPVMVQFGSSEIYECFERIIGDKIDDLTPRDTLTAFMSFKLVHKAEIRDKIFPLLLKKLADNLDLLSIEDLSHLAIVLHTDTEAINLLNLNELISDRSHSLSENDLKNLLLTYRKTEEYRLFEVLEQRMVLELQN
jgi:hypothetical protein